MKEAIYCRIDYDKNSLIDFCRRIDESDFKIHPDWELADYYVDFTDENTAYENLMKNYEKNNYELIIAVDMHSISTIFCGGARVG